jgi:hypothetical protein
MAGEVLKIRKSSGDTIVRYRVPDFHNFGDRMEEIEKQYMDARFRGRKPSSTEVAELAAETEKLSGMLGGLMSALVGKMENEIADLLESRRIAAQEADSSNEADDENAASDEDSTAADVLDIELSDPLTWTSETQQRVDAFLANWPSVRGQVLKAFFEAYRDQYDDIWEFIGGHPADRIRLPEPTSPESIEDIFRFHTLHVSADTDAMGFAGTCTWDDEHGVGARFEGGALAEVGDAAVAFQF